MALPSPTSGVSSARPRPGGFRKRGICRVRASTSCSVQMPAACLGAGLEVRPSVEANGETGHLYAGEENSESPKSPLKFHFGQRIYFIWFLFIISLSLTIFSIFGDIIFLVSFSSLSTVFFSYLSIFKIIDWKSLSPKSIVYPSSGQLLLISFFLCDGLYFLVSYNPQNFVLKTGYLEYYDVLAWTSESPSLPGLGVTPSYRL